MRNVSQILERKGGRVVSVDAARSRCWRRSG